jgi:outer membrane receptor protein involved in Fe transport
MRRGTIALLVAAGLTLLGTLPAAAQSTTGRIRGEVRDPQGTPLPGVLVTLSGDELQGGARSATTGDTGAYSFPGLAPGSYSLTASLEGYQDATFESVQVNLGATTTRDFRILAEFGEELIVAGAVDLVDVTASGVSTTYSAEFIEDLPTTRNFYDLMSVSPGVSLAAEDTDRLVAMGSNVQSNAWYIDGIETTAPETGTAWVGVNPDMIEEIQVQGIGAPAEFGNMMGAALNVVTKSGTNDFEGGANVYWFDDSLVDSSIGFDGSEFSEFSQKEFWDVTGTLGGPLSKDRLFFFGAYEYWRDGHAFPGADPETTPTWYKDRYDLKLSARINDKNLIQAKGYFEDWGFPEPGSQFVADSARAGEVGTTTAWGLDVQSIWTDRTFFEARYSGWKSDDDNLSQTGSTEPAFIDYSPPGGGPAVFTGGVYYPWTYDTKSDQLSAAVSHFADDFLKGDHDFKFGVQVSQGNAETLVATSATGSYFYHYAYTYEYYGNNYVYDYFYRVDGLPYFYGNNQESWAAFVDDSWKVTDRLTLNLGVRFDHQQGSFPSFPRLDPTGNPTGSSIAGADVFEWDNVSPRVGFAYNAGKDRRTVIRGSFGVYYDGNVGGNWNYPPLEHPGLQAYVSFDGFGGPFEEAWSFHPGESIIDPDLKAPRTLQYALGFETQIGDAYSVGVQGIYKDTTDLVGWEILGDGVYEPLSFTDPFTGDTYTLLDPLVFPSLRKGNSPGFTVDPDADEYWQEYWAVILTFDRRMTDWWSMQASYTYSESTGLIPRFLSQWQFNPFYSSREGADPNSYLNANGQNLQGDRPHMLRVQANFELPWGMRANTAVNLQDGRPYTRQGRLPTEGRPVAILERGFRHGFQNLVDVGLGKSFKLKNGYEINLDVQVLNLLNDVESDWFETVVLEPGDEFIPASNGGWIKPRRFQLRAGFRF